MPLINRCAFMLIVAMTAVPTSARAEEPGITMALIPSGPSSNAISVHIPVDKTEGSVPLFLRQDGNTAVEDANLLSTPLTDADGDQTDAQVSFEPSNPVTIPKMGRELSLELNVTGLSSLGTFTSTVYVAMDSSNQVLATLTVQRTRKSGVLLVTDIQAARATKLWPWSTTDVTITIQVKNSGTKPVVVPAPILSQLAVGGSTKFQAEPPVLSVVKPKRPGGAQIEPGDSAPIVVKLSGIRAAGGYSGTLTVKGVSVESVDKSLTFDVKESALLPSILIAVGIGLSFMLRRLFGTGRTRIVQQRRDRRLAEEIQSFRTQIPDMSDQDQDVLLKLERRLQDLYDELDLGEAADAGTILNEIDKKLELFPKLVNARRRVEAITPASLQEPFRKKLEGVVSFLKSSMSTDSELTGSRAVLDVMDADIDKSLREEFLARLGKFEKLANDLAHVPAVTSFVLPTLAAAKRHAEGGQMEAARKDFDAAQRAFAVALADDLVGKLPPASSPPPGFSAGDWTIARDELRAALDRAKKAATGEQAFDAYRNAWLGYMLLVSKALETWASNKRAASTPEAPKLDPIIGACQTAQAKATSGDTKAAAESYERAVRLYEAHIQQSGVRMGAPGTGTPAAMVPFVSAPRAAGVRITEHTPSRTARGFPSSEQLTKRIKRNQWILALVVLVVGLVFGLKFLWADDNTWGGFTAYAAAFLWGLGLHQVTGATFDVTSFGKVLTEGGSATGG